MRRLLLHATVAMATLALGLGACRGDTSPHPPVHWQQNMDNQKRLDPQEPYKRYGDRRAMRRFVEGTVARGHLRIDEHLHHGKKDGKFADDLPPQIRRQLSYQFLKRGQERFDIYCSSCHGGVGQGDGIVFRRKMGLPIPGNFHIDRLRRATIGELFHSMSNGKNNMPAMRRIIPVEDRWAIALYVRALQLSQHADPKDVPANVRGGM